MNTVHDAARRGFTSEARSYARGRPEYSDALVGWLAVDLQLAAGKTVVDLGAGTGKFTKLLVKTGAEVVAVEPVDAMRERLSSMLPGVRAIGGAAESMPLGDASAAAVVCAQAFHWFANEAALQEMHRVIEPGGWLGLVWNVRDDSVDWVNAITDITAPYEGDAPRFYKGDWRKPFDGRLFGELALTTFRHEHVGPAQEVIIDRSMSVSFIAALPADEKARVEARLRALVNTHPALAGQERIVFPYRCEAYRCKRL
ncbi:MAG: Methyltransferase [Rhizobacter sp.]|nr:Methyltransferase [Rhizobacter sp.]